MVLITAATSPLCRLEASRLAASMTRHKWASRLCIVSDAPIYGLKTIVSPSTLWGGRDLKTRFALFPHAISPAEPVAWIDSDSLAIGPEPQWERLPPASVAGVIGTTTGPGAKIPPRLSHISVASPPGAHWPRSMFLHFNSYATAQALCRQWHSNLAAESSRYNDEPALWLALAQTGITALDNRGTITKPAPGLLHYFGRPPAESS